MNKNDRNKVFTIIGASNHALEDRHPQDYYATEPRATELLLEIEEIKHTVLEPCCGEGHISEVLKKAGHEVISSDLIDRDYGIGFADIYDYHNENGILYHTNKKMIDTDFDIVTNPPYKEAGKMTEHIKKYPLKTLHVSSSRLNACKNGDLEKYKSSAVAYGWFVWEKGYQGEPTIKWFN